MLFSQDETRAVTEVSPRLAASLTDVALIRVLDGDQRGTNMTVDGAAISSEGRYRFHEMGERVYFLKAVPKRRWNDRSVPEWTAALDDDAAD